MMSLYKVVGVLLALSATANALYCSSALDLVLLVDGTGSITSSQWATTVQFVLNVSLDLGVSPSTVQIGAAQIGSDYGASHKYWESKNAVIEFPLQSSLPALVTLVNSMKKIGGGTNLGYSLELAQHVLTNGRDSAKKAILMITDGNEDASDGLTTYGHPENVASSLKAQGTAIFVVGVGSDANRTLIRNVASPDTPTANHTFFIEDYSSLVSVLSSVSTLCGDGGRNSSTCGVSCSDYTSCSAPCAVCVLGFCAGSALAPITPAPAGQCNAKCTSSSQCKAPCSSCGGAGLCVAPTAPPASGECGAACKTTSDCGHGGSSCTVCDASFSQCVKPAAPVSPTPAPVPSGGCAAKCTRNSDCGVGGSVCSVCDSSKSICTAPGTTPGSCGGACTEFIPCVDGGCTTCSKTGHVCTATVPPGTCSAACTSNSDCGLGGSTCTTCDPTQLVCTTPGSRPGQSCASACNEFIPCVPASCSTCTKHQCTSSVTPPPPTPPPTPRSVPPTSPPVRHSPTPVGGCAANADFSSKCANLCSSSKQCDPPVVDFAGTTTFLPGCCSHCVQGVCRNGIPCGLTCMVSSDCTEDCPVCKVVGQTKQCVKSANMII